MTEMEKWESLARRVEYKMHAGYTIHNSTVRRHNRHDQVVYNVNGKELTLRQISERDDLQLPLFSEAYAMAKEIKSGL